MVKNREELRQEAQGWLAQAADDLSGRFNDFIETEGFDPVELAEVLDIDEELIYEILDGNLSNITAETLIKMFIANDLAVAIIPVSETPIGQYGRGNGACQRNGRRVGRTHGEMPRMVATPPHGFGQPTTTFGSDLFMGGEPRAVDMTDKQPRDAQGRFMSRKARQVSEPVVRPSNEIRERSHYDDMTLDDLKTIIRRNLWDTEIDINRATRGELIAFLVDKENRFVENKQCAAPVRNVGRTARRREVSTDTPRHCGKPDASCEGSRFGELFKEMFAAAERDPRLAEQIRKFAAHE